MAITVNGKIYRNLQEQVQYLTDRTNDIKPYVAGTGITISGQTIAIDPSVYDEIEALDTALGTKLDKSDIVQELGNSETAVMSQKAATDLLASKEYLSEKIADIDIPDYVKAEAEATIEKSFSHGNLGRTIRFIATADSHNDANNMETADPNITIGNKRLNT